MEMRAAEGAMQESPFQVLFAGKRYTHLVGGRTPRTWSAVKGPVVTETVLLSMVNLRHEQSGPNRHYSARAGIKQVASICLTCNTIYVGRRNSGGCTGSNEDRLLIAKHRRSQEHRDGKKIRDLKPNTWPMSTRPPPVLWNQGEASDWGLRAMMLYERYLAACTQLVPGINEMAVRTRYMRHWCHEYLFRLAMGCYKGRESELDFCNLPANILRDFVKVQKRVGL
jgi:hypothetical protein